ncbi:MAG TPA: hypothetical protein VFT62_00930, partial [Mycobacteriales bacterium]|nr:hypothetical protein [Mycobacteriales bacterium]
MSATDEASAMQLAKAKNTRVRVDAERSETSTTYALPDGSYQQVLHAAPIRAHTASGWQDVDTSLLQRAGRWAVSV